MLRKLLLGSVAAVLSLGVMAAPASAAGAEVAMINGLPFKVDVCLGKTEVISNFRYGQAVFFSGLTPRIYGWSIRLAKTGKCTGAKLATIATTYAADTDYTSVIWKPFSQVNIKTFSNDTSVPADKATLVFRHTAKAPALADVWVWENVQLAADDWAPTFNDVRKGASSAPVEIRPGQYSIDVWASKRTKSFSWEGYWSRTDAGQVYEAYLIGTTKKNFKIVSVYGPGVVTPEP